MFWKALVLKYILTLQFLNKELLFNNIGLCKKLRNNSTNIYFVPIAIRYNGPVESRIKGANRNLIFTEYIKDYKLFYK